MEGTGLLGMQIESERMWDDSGLENFINSLGTLISLLPSKITKVKQYPLPTAALMEIDEVVTDLEKKRGIIKRTNLLYSSLLWPVKKLTWHWHFKVY